MIFEEAGVYQFGVVHNNELLLPYEDDFFITLTFLCVAVVVHIIYFYLYLNREECLPLACVPSWLGNHIQYFVMRV